MDELREVCPDLDKYIDIIKKNGYNVDIRLSQMDSEQLSAANSISSCMDKMSDWRKMIYSEEDISIYLIDIVARYIFKRWKMGDITIDELVSIGKRNSWCIRQRLVMTAILIVNEENNDEETVNKAVVLVDTDVGYYSAISDITLNASKTGLDKFRRSKILYNIDIGYLISNGILIIKNTCRMKEWISFFSNDDIVVYLKRGDVGVRITPLIASILIERVGFKTLIEICEEPTVNGLPNVASCMIDITLHLNV